MNKSYIMRFFLVSLLIVVTAGAYLYEYYNDVHQKVQQAKSFAIEQEANLMKTTLVKALKNKKKALNAIAIALVFDSKLPKRLRLGDIPPDYAKTLVHALKKDTLYKNTWLKLYDANAKTVYRSWVDAENIEEVLPDSAEHLLAKKKLLNYIDVGYFDLSINAFIPVVDAEKTIVGALEVKAHFNSISKQLGGFGIDSVVLVDKRFKTKLYKPFTGIFVEDYYVANFDAKQVWLSYIKQNGIERFLHAGFRIEGDTLIVSYPVKDIGGETIAYYVMFKDMSAMLHDFKSEEVFDFYIIAFVAFIGVLLILLLYESYLNTRQKKFFQSIIDNSRNIVIVTNGKETLDANKMFLKYFGFSSIEEFAKSDKSCLNDYFIDEEGYLKVIMEGKHWFLYVLENPQRQHKAKLKIADKIYYFLITATRVSGYEGVYSVVMADITAEENYRIKLEQTNVTDYLTGVKNRKYFHEKIKEEILLAERYNRPFSIIMLDIDHFKKINDKYGHDIGDKVLVEYSALIQKHIREPDILCRTGGEEFVIILPETTLDDAVRVARKIREVVKEHQKIVPITVSLGVVEYIKGESEKDIYKRADNALYKAKSGGRDKVIIG